MEPRWGTPSLVYEFNACFARATFWRMEAAEAVQANGLGLAFSVKIMHDRLLQLGDAVEGVAADAFFGDLGEEGSTKLSQEAEVGVKCRWRRMPAASQLGTFGRSCGWRSFEDKGAGGFRPASRCRSASESAGIPDGDDSACSCR